MTAKNLHKEYEKGSYYHVYNKGVESKTIFAEEADYQAFIDYLEDYLNPPKSPESTKKDFTVNGRVFKGVPHQPKNYFNKVELIAYSLKPDHFHLILNQKTPKSLQAFLRSFCTRYSIYFNKKYERTGALFAGPYKSVALNDDSGLLLLTHYLHNEGGYSTYPQYSGQKPTPWVNTKVVLSIKNSKGNYQDFVEKYELSKTDLGLLDPIIIEKIDHHLERRDLAEISSKPSLRIPELLLSSIVFVLLLGIGLRNITTVAKNPQNTSVILGTTTTSTSPAPTSKPEPKIMLKVKYTNEPINIREEATTSSKIIGEAHQDDKFEFVSQHLDWSQIKLTDNSTGFIFSTFVEKEQEANND